MIHCRLSTFYTPFDLGFKPGRTDNGLRIMSRNSWNVANPYGFLNLKVSMKRWFYLVSQNPFSKKGSQVQLKAIKISLSVWLCQNMYFSCSVKTSFVIILSVAWSKLQSLRDLNCSENNDLCTHIARLSSVKKRHFPRSFAAGSTAL